MYRILIAGCVLVVALAACTGGSRPPSRTSAPPSISLDGQVLDADSGQPISGVSVSAGNQEVSTGADGSFSLGHLSSGMAVAFASCAYSPVSLTATSSATEVVRMQALPVTVTVSSNLSGKGLPARVDGAATGQADKKGRLTLSGVCPGDELSFSASGYADRTIQVDESRTLKAKLEANPATSVKQEVAWEAAQKWSLACSLMHPDTFAYVTKAECVKILKSDAAQGYQSVSIKVKSVTYVKWTFAKCSLTSFGPKTYRHTAAINYTLQQSTPGGGVAPISGIQHWVQAKDGTWRYFLLNGCDVPIS
jgi:hypothetical protein